LRSAALLAGKPQILTTEACPRKRERESKEVLLHTNFLGNSGRYQLSPYNDSEHKPRELQRHT